MPFAVEAEYRPRVKRKPGRYRGVIDLLQAGHAERLALSVPADGTSLWNIACGLRTTAKRMGVKLRVYKGLDEVVVSLKNNENNS
jgi:hypothetical protein